jgi:hypothetical protein
VANNDGIPELTFDAPEEEKLDVVPANPELGIPELTFGKPPATEIPELTFLDDPNLDRSPPSPVLDTLMFLPNLMHSQWEQNPRAEKIARNVEKVFNLTPEGEFARQQKAERLKDLTKTTISTMIQYNPQIMMFPGTRAERIAEDLFSEGFGRPLSSVIEGLGMIFEEVGVENPIDDFGRALEEVLVDPLDAARAEGRDFGQEDFGDDLSQGIASTLGFIAAGGTARAIGLGKAAITGTVATLGAAVGAQGGRLDAEYAEAHPEQVKAAYWFNGLLGTSEAVPIMKLFNRVDKATGGILSRRIKSDVVKIGINGIGGAIEEGLQESFQTIGQNKGADWIGYDPTRSWNENLGSAASVGGTVGFLMNVLGASLGIRDRRGKKRNIEEGLGEEALRVTGAKSLDELAFGREGHEGEIPGVVQITTLSEAYLREQKILAAVNDRLNELGKRGRLLYSQNFVNAKTAREIAADFKPDSELERLDPLMAITQEKRAEWDQGKFGPDEHSVGPSFLSFLETDKPVFVSDASHRPIPSHDPSIALQQKDIVNAMSLNINRSLAAIEGIKTRLEAEKALLESDPTPHGEEMVKGLTRKLAIEKAKLSEMKAFSVGLSALMRDVAKIFPQGTKFLLHDMKSTVDTASIQGVEELTNFSGVANVLTIRTGAQHENTTDVQSIGLDPENLLLAAARLKVAKLDGASESELASKREVLDRERAGIMSTFYHEVGHHYAFKHWVALRTKLVNGTATKAEKDLFRALQADYHRYIVEGLRSPAKAFLAKAHSLHSASGILADWLDIPNKGIENFSDPAADNLQSIALEPRVTGEDVDYLMSFDEYMAEEFSKMAMDKNLVNKDVAPFFRKGVKDQKKILAQHKGKFRMTSEAMGNHFLGLSARGRMALAIKKMEESNLEVSPVLAAEKNGLMSPELARERIEEIDKFNRFMDIGFNILQIAENNPHIKGLQDYVETMRLWKNDVNENLSIAQATITAWQQLGKKEQELLGRIMLDETVGLTFDGKTLRQPRNFTDAEVAKYKLSPEALELRQKIKADFARSLDQMESVLKQSVNQMFLEDPQRQAAELGARNLLAVPCTRMDRLLITKPLTRNESAMLRGSNKLLRWAGRLQLPAQQ